MKTVLCVLLCLAAPATAIELSLEENKGERGSIGYVDMQKLFRAHPETGKAKENFEELVRQAEEQVNLRKAEVLRLRSDLSQLKIQREFVARTPIAVTPPPPQPPAPAPAPKAPEPAPPALSTAPMTAATQPPAPPHGAQTQETPVDSRDFLPTLPGFAGAPQPKREPRVINIPGVSTAPIVVQPPAAPQPSLIAKSTAAPALPAEAVDVSSAALNAALVEIDARIALKAKELAQKEAEFRDYQAAAEKSLLELETRKTEILLGKIHRAIQEVARREGVSVVVDKGTILFGHTAVDLTEKVLKHLKGT